MQAQYNRVTNTFSMKLTPHEFRMFKRLIGRTNPDRVEDVTGTNGVELFDVMSAASDEAININPGINMYSDYNGVDIFRYVYGI